MPGAHTWSEDRCSSHTTRLSVVCILHDGSATGAHTLHNFSTERITDNSVWSTNYISQPNTCKRRYRKKIRSRVRQEFSRKTGCIPVKNCSPQELVMQVVFMLIISEKEKGKKKNMKERMVACRSHACWCSVARLSPNSWLVSFVVYNSWQRLFALSVNSDRGYLHQVKIAYFIRSVYLH